MEEELLILTDEQVLDMLRQKSIAAMISFLAFEFILNLIWLCAVIRGSTSSNCAFVFGIMAAIVVFVCPKPMLINDSPWILYKCLDFIVFTLCYAIYFYVLNKISDVLIVRFNPKYYNR